jgi:tetratricopeptide (TPR) repeat protein
MDPTTFVRTDLTCLDRLDGGGFRLAVDMYEAGHTPASGAPGALWRAEVAVYLDRREDALRALAEVPGALLDKLTDPGAEGDLARRHRLAASALAYADGAYGEALAHAEAVLAASAEADDARARRRAAYDAGRALRRQGRYDDARGRLDDAHRMARSEGNDFYLGLVAFNRALAANDLGQAEEAAALALEALALLERAENLRYRALCQNFYGGLLADFGRLDDALVLCSEAEATAVELGVFEDTLRAATGRARVLLSLGRYEEAAERLAELVGWQRGSANSFLEFHALCLLSVAQFAAGRHADAAESAGAALALARIVGTAEDVLDAELLDARAAAWSPDGRASAVARLRDFVRTADASGTPIQRLESRAYLAQALAASDPLEAYALCAEVRSMPALAAAGWIARELERAEGDLARGPIRLDERGALVIDPSLHWPTLRLAREAVERYLVTRAVGESGGNLSAAGRLLGESRYQMFALNRFLQGRSPRPSRGKAGPGAAGAPARRRARGLHAKDGAQEEV